MLGFPLIRTVAHCFRTVSSVVVDLLRLAFLARIPVALWLPRTSCFANNWRSSRSAKSNHDEPTIPSLDNGDARLRVPMARCAGECTSTATMIRQLRSLGYRIELPDP